MDIRKKINFTREELTEHGPITIVAFGDSVTHGAVAPGEINYETVYWNRLKQKINAIRNYTPVNVINSGIGGINAKESIPLTESRVLAHNPDLVIVCFGLNDINCELDIYLDSLRQIFKKCIDFGTEVIFMTPNMLNTYFFLLCHQSISILFYQDYPFRVYQHRLSKLLHYYQYILLFS